jgi:hypothetical protein
LSEARFKQNIIDSKRVRLILSILSTLKFQHHFQLGTAQRQFPDSLSLPCFELADVEVLHSSS